MKATQVRTSKSTLPLPKKAAPHTAKSNGPSNGVVNGKNGTADSHALLKALIALKRGDFSVRMPVDLEGVDGKVADTLNEIIDMNERMVAEFERIRRTVGKDGK